MACYRRMSWCFGGEALLGWEVRSVSVQVNILSLEVRLAVDCSEEAALDVDICGANTTCELKVCGDFIVSLFQPHSNVQGTFVCHLNGRFVPV